jgi:YHS domain-containing protein
MRHQHGRVYYFCSLRCAERFDARETSTDVEPTIELPRDPVCGMTVNPLEAINAVGPDDVTYYFCGEGCRHAFLDAPTPHVEHH